MRLKVKELNSNHIGLVVVVVSMYDDTDTFKVVPESFELGGKKIKQILAWSPERIEVVSEEEADEGGINLNPEYYITLHAPTQDVSLDKSDVLIVKKWADHFYNETVGWTVTDALTLNKILGIK